MYMSTKSNKENEDINKRLETVIGILLNQSKIQQWSLGDKIRHLSPMGYDNNDIAKTLDTSYGMVAKEKSKGKKAK